MSVKNRNNVPLPLSVRSWLDHNTHPGLELDKYAATFLPSNASGKWQELVQKPTAEQVVRLSQASPLGSDWSALHDRWLAMLTERDTQTFACSTTGPLTLHLARASALENAGICLHPLYGFAYLPGSGLKGMARAYAETIWLPAEANKQQAWRQIENVFGWAPGSDKGKEWKPAGIPERERHDNARVGGIVFHDAWPESWPQLVVDIVNNHHPEYYQAAPEDNEHPPGDWENPKPVYFLAVKAGTTFTFPLSKRRPDDTVDLLALAREWLLGALCHLGVGAKTVAGYGAFKPVNEEVPAQTTAVFPTTLELVTPAFLAGASQQADDCDLRPATLRGLLHWWWRTMHAGFVDVKTLRILEAAIWGDTRSGGAVRIELARESGGRAALYRHSQDQPGIRYAAYGMDEGGQQRRQRCCLEPPASWRLRLLARRTRFFVNRKDISDPQKVRSGKPVTAQMVLNQAKSALWLLCHFGGVGSKSRKGFGSLAASKLDEWNMDECRSMASQLRQHLQLPNSFKDELARSASVQQMLDPVELLYSWPNIWSMLDQVGLAYQSVAQQRAHRQDKLALGLPRQIHGPRNQPLPHQQQATHQRPQRLRGPKGDRHSSPVHIHVEPRDAGWTVRVIALPAAYLPDLTTSRAFLKEFIKDFGDDLRRRVDLQPPPSGPGQGSAQKVVGSPLVRSAQSRMVKVRFLGPHTSLKNAFWVEEVGKKKGLLKYGMPPTPLPAENSEIEVYRTNDNPNSPEYRWDAPPPSNPSRGGSGGQRPPRRR